MSNAALVVKATGEIVDLPGEVSGTALVLPDDLTFEEWEEYGRRLFTVEQGVNWWLGDWWAFGDAHYGERAAQALDPESPAFQTFVNAGNVSRKFETNRRRLVLSWSHHAEVASLPAAVADRLLDLAEKVDDNGKRWSTRDLRQQVRLLKTAERIGKAAEEALALEAEGKFQVLYVDPPWRYEYAQSSSREIENNYPTMDLEEIKQLELPAADDSVLFCWTTSPKLAESLEAIDAWGFEYRTSLVWVKGDNVDSPTIGMGYYARQAHEILLVAKRGSLPVPAAEDRPASVIAAPRQAHSEKPAEFYDLIERMYPALSKIELFARSNRDGWRAWGNQA